MQLYYYSGAVHHNPEFFSNPKTFKPDRFLDADGKFVPDERVIYFGIGKRRCVGEILGRAEAYLFAATLLQRFSLEAAPGCKPDIDDYIPGLNMHIIDHHAVMTPRY